MSEALSRSGLLGPARRPPPGPTESPWSALSSDSSMPPSSRQPLLKRAPLHMKKMPKMGGAATAGTRDPRSKGKTGGGREDSSAIADPSKRRRTPGEDDILGEALGGKKRTRSPGPSPAKYKGGASMPGPPSCDGERRTINKAFHVENYDGSVHVPQPSAVLFRRTSTVALRAAAVTPSPVGACDRAQPPAAILKRQRDLAELSRREGKDAAGGASTTTAGAGRNGIVRGGGTPPRSGVGATRAARTTNATSASGGDPPPRRDDGRGDFASAFGVVAADDDGAPATGPSSLELVASARSRFASAVDAREYARARGAVQALEDREQSSRGGKRKDANEKGKGGGPVVATSAIVTSGWSCLSCGKITPFKPASCIRYGHDVRQRRELKEEGRRSAIGSLGSRKDQLDRHGREDEEGGLTLGSGLQWSGWRGGFE